MKIRTLGLYQPFATAMLHDKIETRWVKKGKKPPFPLGKYLLYSTKKKYENFELYEICGQELMSDLISATKEDPTLNLKGYGICIGDLVKVELMQPIDSLKAFVRWRTHETHDLIALHFENVERITPFEIKGKQGIGFIEYPITSPHKTTIKMKKGIELIAEERQEQIEKHGRTVLQDYDYNNDGQLLHAAERMLHGRGHESCNYPPVNWDRGIWDKMLDKPKMERLIIAGALIAAEIDRLLAEQAFSSPHKTTI